MYTLPGCIWCASARRRLRRRGIEFEEIGAETITDYRGFLAAETGRSTVPQILIDSVPIGGADNLAMLDRSGALLPRVRRERFPVVLTNRRLGILGWHHHVRVVDANGEVLDSVKVRSLAASEVAAAKLAVEFPPRYETQNTAGDH